MTKTIGKILGILLSISIIVTGIFMMVQCLSIYNSGDKPYTRDVVASAFGEIKISIIITVALLITSCIYNFFVPDIYPKDIKIKNNSFIISAINKNKAIDALDNAKVKKERMLRKVLSVILMILVVLGFTFFGIYALNPLNFHQSEINASMIKAMTLFCICISAPFIFSIICIFINSKSQKREIDTLRELAKVSPPREAMPIKDNSKLPLIFKISILILCVAIILYGLLTGGTEDVLTKAINICTECIGLG